ncbi:MAG: TonB-dependent receptor [Bacteroidota bacterium]|nr:TonB-dependent receptor [Bacteroidota bacterium]
MQLKNYILLLISLLFAGPVQAQHIKVIDRVSYKPLSDLYVFCGDTYAVTNENGIIKADAFKPGDTIIIQYNGYREYRQPYNTVKNSNFLIYLTPNIIQVEEIVVSANKWEQNKREVPTKITSISRKAIELYNPQTAADLLKTSEEVFVQKSQMGGGSPMIRGYAANRVLLTVDGVRMNNAIFRSGNLQNVISLDANAIEGTEVIFGPGSLIYGSDAIGGVMNFSTLKAKISGSENTNNTLNFLARYSSANFEKTGHLDFNIGNKKWAFLSSFSYSDFDDLHMGKYGNTSYQRYQYVEVQRANDLIIANDNPEIQKFTAYSQLNFMQKVRFKPTYYLDMTYAFHFSKTSDVPRYDRLIQYADSSLKYAEWYYGPQKWMMNSFTLKYTKANSVFDKFIVVLAHQDYEESRHDRKINMPELRERYENVKIWSTNIDFEKDVFSDSKLFYGIEFVHNDVFSQAELKNISNGEKSDYASRYPDDSNYNSGAAYISYTIPLADKLNASTGVRYNYISLNAGFNDKFYDFPFDEINLNTGSITGSIGAVYKATDNFELTTNISSGFRAPNIDDAGKVFDSEPGNVVVPNPDLKPEYAYNADLGLKKQFFDKAEFSLTGFYSILTNIMVRRDFSFNGQDSIWYDNEMSNVQALVNADYGIVFGGHLGVKFHITDFIALKSNWNITKGEDSEGKPIRHVAPTFGTVHLLASANRFTADIYLVYNGEISHENLAESERDKPHMYALNRNNNLYSPSWSTLNLKASWQLTKTIKLNGGVENILDNRYRPYSSGIVAPGRNFILSIKASF